MFRYLNIYDSQERAAVGAADAALRVIGPLTKAGRAAAVRPPCRVLLLRLERIGDLLMTLEAIADVRAALPDAEIDLVTGSWNAELAAAIPGVTRVESLDAGWLAREGTGLPFRRLLARAADWRSRAYGLAINFEPDIRSNVLLASSRAARTAGFFSGGGGPLLDVALRHDPRLHTSENARRLVAAVLNVPSRTAAARLRVPEGARARAASLLARCARRPLVGVHVSGGRPIKQWDPLRFAETARRLAAEEGAAIVLTGSVADAPLVKAVGAALPDRTAIDISGEPDLLTLAAVLEQLDVYVTGDSGPMHLAAAVGTPVVAIFGPSDPVRYAPTDVMHRVVRIDLPCSPCNRIRLPPERCVGHMPDCLAGIDSAAVVRAAAGVLRSRAHPSRPAHRA